MAKTSEAPRLGPQTAFIAGRTAIHPRPGKNGSGPFDQRTERIKARSNRNASDFVAGGDDRLVEMLDEKTK